MGLFKNVFSVGFIGAVLVGGPALVASAAPSTAQSAAPRVDDSALKSQIAESLKKNAVLAPRHIDVDVEQGVVTLTGTVRTPAEKTRAAGVAKVKGAVRVVNKIEVDPKVDQSKIDAAGEKTKAGVTKGVDATVTATQKAKEGVEKGVGKAEQGVGKAADKTAEALGKAGDKVGDASVTTRVKSGLSRETLLRDTAIDVDTTDRVVTLRGTVHSIAESARAAEIAGGTDGVTRVVNQLVVTPK